MADVDMLPPAPSSPIDRIPVEVLEDILVRVCNSTPLILPPSKTRLYPPQLPVAPLQLGWVCRQWRAITLASTAFWTPPKIQIDLEEYELGELWEEWSESDDSDDDSDSEFALESAERKARLAEHDRQVANAATILKCYLERSGSAPLPYVHISALLELEYDFFEDYWEPSFGPILRTLAPSLPRWRECTIPVFLANILRELTGGARPLLLEDVHMPHAYDSILDSDVFVDAPRLRKWTGPIDGIQLPWTQLTHLHVTVSTPIRNVLMLLPKLKHVVDLDLCISDGESDAPPIANAVLRRLRTLRVHVPTRRALSRLFLALKAPELQDLTVVGTGSSGLKLRTWPMRTFTTMLERSQCVLRSLHLKQTCMPQAQFVAVLEKVPRLQEFTIANHKVANDVARPDRPSTIGDTVLKRMITREGSASTLLPELRVLKIEGSLQFDPEVLVEMVKSRTNPRLEHVHLLMDGKSDVDVNEPLEGRLKEIMGEKGYTWDWSSDVSFKKWGVPEAMGRAMEEVETLAGIPESSI